MERADVLRSRSAVLPSGAPVIPHELPVQPIVNSWTEVEGSPTPLGATWIAEQKAHNFALYSKHASAVTLLLYGEDPANPVKTLELTPLVHKTGRVWHCRIPEAEAPGARYYAYRIAGPNDGTQGHRYDPEKVLLDPYANAVHFPPGFDRGAACRPGSNAGRAPLGVLPWCNAPFDWGADRRPNHTSDAIVYELHVKGFTAQDPEVPPERRGTYAGVVDKIPYLKSLGVTVVELLPVQQFDPQEGSYWGYMTLHFFSPHQAYASAKDPAGCIKEFRTMVKALHQAGIAVILDVVYNHTTEGGDGGPTYSFRGIDNSTYYLLTSDLAHYRNDAGTGNVFRAGHSVPRKLVLDSLRFWAREMHVDGFRFDLATIFTRSEDGQVDTDDPAIVQDISDDPELTNVRLIAEAWDLDTYQLGRTFPGRTWLQWNGRYRDDLRSFVKSDPGMVGSLVARIYGSDDLFQDHPTDVYHPFQSVNFVACHDGFCLYDLVAYDQKHNEANGQGNTDGSDSNLSWNCGAEGDPAPPQVLQLRRRQAKNFCALLLLSNGTPMFCAGDEFLRTQRGNNNPYNQDNPTTWIDWSLLGRNADVARFFQAMIAFRKSHKLLGHNRFWRDRVRWYGADGPPDFAHDSRSIAFHLQGDLRSTDPSLRAAEPPLYVMINAFWEDLAFQIQEGSAAGWRRVVDTGLDSPDDIALDRPQPLATMTYPVKARSVVVLEGDP
jgi:glycogen operon protein